MKTLTLISLFLIAAAKVFGQCDSSIDLALGRTTVTSSVQSSVYPGSNAVDGDTTNSRWSSASADNQYIYVDLGAVYSLCYIKLYWEAAYGKDFTIDVSNDASTWTTIVTVTGNTALKNAYSVSASGRYVRMYGIHRGTSYGFSLYEILVFGAPTCNATNIALGMPTAASTTQSGYPASNAVDGLITTRWASTYADNQWIYVDLGTVHSLCEVDIAWETAYASDYNIDVSNDATTWTTVLSITGNTSTANINNVSGSSGRYVRIYGIHRATSYGFSIEEINIKDLSILPVNFVSFTGMLQTNKKVLLQWTTAGEVNNDHFAIERSSDNKTFSSIGEVTQNGHAYSWTDASPLDGINYYRLQQIDKDGKSSYSKVIAVSKANTAHPDLTLYPNPAKDRVYLRSNTSLNIKDIKVYNSAGIQVLDYTGTISSNETAIPIASLAPGVYWVKVTSDNNSTTLRLLK